MIKRFKKEHGIIKESVPGHLKKVKGKLDTRASSMNVRIKPRKTSARKTSARKSKKEGNQNSELVLPKLGTKLPSIVNHRAQSSQEVDSYSFAEKFKSD